MEKGATVPAIGGIPTDRAVDNLDIAERAQPAAYIGAIPTHRAAIEDDQRVKESINASAVRRLGRIIPYRAVNQVKRAAIAIVDSSATFPPILAIGCDCVLFNRDVVECQGAVVQDATCQLETITINNLEMADEHIHRRIDYKWSHLIAAADRQTRRAAAVDG